MLEGRARLYVARYYERMRKANQKATEASNRWELRNAEINDLLDREGQFDIVQRAKVKEANLGLRDAMDEWSFWEREAKRCHSVITGELAVRQLLGEEV